MTELTVTDQAENILKTVDLKDRHSYYQLGHFVLGKEPTIQSKLWQCVREISPRLETLIALEEEIIHFDENYEILEVKIKILESKIKNLNKNIKIENNHLKSKIVEIKKKRLERTNNKKDIIKEKLLKKKRMIEEELIFFVKNFSELEKIEKIKNWDDFNLQNELWSAKLGSEINLRLLLNLPTDLELCKTVLALPDNNQIKLQLVNSLKNIQYKLVQVNKENTKTN